MWTLLPTPQLPLPSKILEVLKVCDNALMPYLSILCWSPDEDVRAFRDLSNEVDESLNNYKEREYWAQHDMYKEKGRESLQKMAKKTLTEQ